MATTQNILIGSQTFDISAHLYAGSGSAANAATTNGNTKLTVTNESTVRNNVSVVGTGATSVTSDANGKITINSTDTTYSFADGENSFTVTPSGESAQTVEVTPILEGSATNSFDDGIDSYFKQVVSTIVPVQAGSGTPSPTNVRAISGFTECVVKDFGNNFMPQKDVSVTNTVYTSCSVDLPAGTYTISAQVSTDVEGGACRLSFRKGALLTQLTYVTIYASSERTSVTVTLRDDCTTIFFYAGNSAAISGNATYTDIQIERGSTATAYTPYVTPTTATISFGSAGTVYGGEVDLISGKLTVDRAVITDISSLAVRKNIPDTTNYLYYIERSGILSNFDTSNPLLICSHAPTLTSPPENVVGVSLSASTSVIYFNFGELTDNTVSGFRSFWSTNNVQLAYKLATPQEYQLTPALLRSLVGTNNLTSSTGEVTEVEYITNKTVAYVDDKVESIVDTNSTFTFTLYGVPYASLTTANTDITQYSSATVADIKTAVDAGKFIFCKVFEDEAVYTGLSLEAGNVFTALSFTRLALIAYGKKYSIIVSFVNNKILSEHWDEYAYPTSIRSPLQIDSYGYLSAPGADYVHTISTTSANFVTGADLTSYCSDAALIRYELRGQIASWASTNVRLNIRLDNSREMIAVPFSNFTTNSSGTFAIFKTKTLDIDDNGARQYKNIIISVSPQVYPNNSKVTLELYEDAVQNNAGFHNSIYRGKFLGTSITAEQYAQISAGTFDDMFIGDYWTISTTLGNTTKNVDYVIAGFDYWWNVGDSYPQSTNKHHIVLVPRDSLYNARMNATNTTTGGYVGSEMYTTNLADARTGISNAFSGHLYSVRRQFTNSVDASGQTNYSAWNTSSVDLMSETMVYGTKVWGNSGFEVGCDIGILPLFCLDVSSRNGRVSWWLRSVAFTTSFGRVGTYGNAEYGLTSYTYGVRPCFAIYGGD